MTFDQKSRALEEGSLGRLLDELGRVPEHVARQVTVEARLEGRVLTVSIADMGQGFDWRNLADPQDPSNLLSTHGRGVLLARLSVDSLAYNEEGNRVTVTKRL